MAARFQDVFQFEISDLIIDSFSGIYESEILDEKRMTLQSDFEFKLKFNVLLQFWLQNQIAKKYPYAWDRVKIFFIAAGTW